MAQGPLLVPEGRMLGKGLLGGRVVKGCVLGERTVEMKLELAAQLVQEPAKLLRLPGPKPEGSRLVLPAPFLPALELVTMEMVALMGMARTRAARARIAWMGLTIVALLMVTRTPLSPELLEPEPNSLDFLSSLLVEPLSLATLRLSAVVYLESTRL